MSRPPRRRGRRAAPPPASFTATAPSAPSEKQSTGYGRGALILALLLGMLAERAALHLPTEARDIFHFVVLVGIALLVARIYRGFARRAVERSRRRRSRGRDD